MDLDKITAVLGIVGKIKSALDKADQAQVRVLVTSLQEMATDAKLEAIAAKEENVKLREELLSLKALQNTKNVLTQKDDGLYYSAESKIPYCPRCYEINSKKVTLHKKTLSHGDTIVGDRVTSWGQDVWNECPECENEYLRHFEP
jgi:hypothetical protein